MNDVKAILFDLDGTIADSAQGIMSCYRHTIDKLGLCELSDEKLRTFIGPPIPYNFETTFQNVDIDRAMKIYFDYMVNEKTATLQNSLFDGIQDAIKRITLAGKFQYICSSKRSITSVEILDYFSLSSHFKGVYGANDDGSGADKAFIIGQALAAHDLDLKTTVMVGDRFHDIDGAKKHGLRSIGVAWGYGSEEELRDAGADEYVKTPEELLSLII